MFTNKYINLKSATITSWVGLGIAVLCFGWFFLFGIGESTMVLFFGVVLGIILAISSLIVGLLASKSAPTGNWKRLAIGTLLFCLVPIALLALYVYAFLHLRIA